MADRQVRRWKRTADWLRRESRRHAATEHFPWFRAGYITALDDIERTGLRPTAPDTKRRAADRALERWIEND